MSKLRGIKAPRQMVSTKTNHHLSIMRKKGSESDGTYHNKEVSQNYEKQSL